MELEKELAQFHQEAQRLKAGRRSGSLPFPEALRAFAVRYVAYVRKTGGTVAAGRAARTPAHVGDASPIKRYMLGPGGWRASGWARSLP